MPTSSSNISSNTDKSNNGSKNLKFSKTRQTSRLQIPEGQDFSHSLPNMTHIHYKLSKSGLPCTKDEVIQNDISKKTFKSSKKNIKSKKKKEATIKTKGVKQVQKEIKEEIKDSKKSKKASCKQKETIESLDDELEERCRKWVADVAREKFENPDQLFIPHLLVP